MAEVPQLAALYKKYSEQGFHIIGLECQRSADDVIANVAKSKGAGYQMTTGGDLKGSNVSGLPHGFLFGADGKLAVDDPPNGQLEKKVKELLKDSAGFMAGPGPYVKLAALAAQIKSGQGLGTVLKTLAAKKESKDAAEQAEAVMMYDALHGAAEGQLEGALGKKDTEPAAALVKLDKIALTFAGDEVATKAKTEADAMRKDPKVKKEVEADAMWKQVEAMTDKLKPVRGEKNYKDDAFRKANAASIQGIVGGCQGLTQRFAGTAAASKAESLMNEFR